MFLFKPTSDWLSIIQQPLLCDDAMFTKLNVLLL